MWSNPVSSSWPVPPTRSDRPLFSPRRPRPPADRRGSNQQRRTFPKKRAAFCVFARDFRPKMGSNRPKTGRFFQTSANFRAEIGGRGATTGGRTALRPKFGATRGSRVSCVRRFSTRGARQSAHGAHAPSPARRAAHRERHDCRARRRYNR